MRLACCLCGFSGEDGCFKFDHGGSLAFDGGILKRKINLPPQFIVRIRAIQTAKIAVKLKGTLSSDEVQEACNGPEKPFCFTFKKPNYHDRFLERVDKHVATPA